MRQILFSSGLTDGIHVQRSTGMEILELGPQVYPKNQYLSCHQ